MQRKWLKKEREAKQLSQGALANLVGLKVSELSRIELGYRDVSPREAKAIAKILGFDPDWFFPKPVTAQRILPDEIRREEVAPPATTRIAMETAQPAVQKPAEAPVAAPAPAPKYPLDIRQGPNLADPAKFDELPDPSWLVRGTLAQDDFLKRLSLALKYATVILHTSKVTPPIWREWRSFEKAAQDVLRQAA